MELVLQTLVHAKHVTDLTTADTDVAGRNVAVMADVAPKLHHEGLAEAHDFSIGFALGVEVRTTFAATHGEAGQGILENLLEREELEDGSVHAGVESESTLVGANGTVELNTEATVDVDFTCIVGPGHTEMDEALRLDHALNNGNVLWIRLKHGLERFKHFFHRLVEFRLVGVTGYDFCINCVTGAHRHTFSHPKVCCAALAQTLSNGCPCSISVTEDSRSKNGTQKAHTVR